jgi:hypothetical protein
MPSLLLAAVETLLALTDDAVDAVRLAADDAWTSCRDGVLTPRTLRHLRTALMPRFWTAVASLPR